MRNATVELAKSLAMSKRNLVVRKATVTTVNEDATIKVKFGGTENEIDYDVPCLDAKEPSVDDDVWLLVQGSMMLCIGYAHTSWEA